MPSLNAAVIGSPEYSKKLGKKSTETDITFYDLKKGARARSVNTRYW